MQANPRTLDTLFNSQLRYVVPMFQRLYVWQEDPQWKTLWEDVIEKAVLQLQAKKSNAHYLGALLIEGVRPSSPREVKRFLVIDGQQRLTTLQLMLCAFRDCARKNDWKTLDRTTSRFLENADADVMEHPEEERFKLWPTSLNRTVFADIITAGSREAVEAKYPLRRLPRRRRPEPRNALVNAYVYFANQITRWISETAVSLAKTEESCAFTLLQSLQQDFCVVEIALSEGGDSQEIFYSLNSQGRPLSQSDLLRSLIFMRAEKEHEDRDKIFDDYWGRFETAFWSQEVRRGGRTYSRLDLGLRFFLMAKTGALVDARRVNEEYRQWITADPPRYPSIRNELADFSKHCDVYARYEVTEPGLSSTDIRRFIQDLDVSTVLPLLMFLELDANLAGDALKECLAIVESFVARRAIANEETKEYNKLFVEIVGELAPKKGAEVLPVLQEKLLAGGGTTRRWPTDDEIVERIVSAPLFTALPTPILRLVLERLELALRGKKSEDQVIPSGLQIEHVLPQSWATHWPMHGKVIPDQIARLPSVATDEFKPLVDAIRLRNNALHTLGNLTLVNKYLNPAAGHGDFPMKRNEYTHSVLRLNRYFDGLAEWNEQSISTRGKILGQLLCKIWPRPERAGGH